MLLTAHRAKGLEFDHVIVLDRGWRKTGRNEDPDAWRRLYYVAMTRAKKTLALAKTSESDGPATHGAPEVSDERMSSPTYAAPIPELRGNPSVLHRRAAAYRQTPPDLDLRRETLSLKDIHLSFPGRRAFNNSIHGAIGRLNPGDELRIRTGKTPWEITTRQGQLVGQLARQYKPLGQFHSARVHAVVNWRREDSEPEYRDGLRCDEWEVVVPELVFT